MKIGFVTLGMGSAPLEDVLKTGMAAGCEVMELNGRATVHRNLWAPPIDYAGIKARVAASGVAVSSLGGYSNFAQLSDEGVAQQVEQLVGYCQVAREMGIPVVRAFSGDVVEGHTLDELYPRIVAGFKAVTQRVAGWGLKIGIENHGKLVNNGDYLASLIGEVGSPILGMTIDTGNFCWAGHSIETAQRFFEKLAPVTVNVHIKDGKFISGEWVLFPAGRGDLDLPALFRLLAARGYDGPVVSEYEGQADFAASTTESVAYLRGLRDSLTQRH
jgi:sugar phosphate isomerase/epimerase